MSKTTFIDPISIIMSDIASKISIVIEAGFKNESILHIKIDPEEILKKIPKFVETVMQTHAQYMGHNRIYDKPPTKVVIHFDGHKYIAKAEYKEVTTEQFKGYKK